MWSQIWHISSYARPIEIWTEQSRSECHEADVLSDVIQTYEAAQSRCRVEDRTHFEAVTQENRVLSVRPIECPNWIPNTLVKTFWGNLRKFAKSCPEQHKLPSKIVQNVSSAIPKRVLTSHPAPSNPKRRFFWPCTPTRHSKRIPKTLLWEAPEPLKAIIEIKHKRIPILNRFWNTFRHSKTVKTNFIERIKRRHAKSIPNTIKHIWGRTENATRPCYQKNTHLYNSS